MRNHPHKRAGRRADQALRKKNRLRSLDYYFLIPDYIWVYDKYIPEEASKEQIQKLYRRAFRNNCRYRKSWGGCSKNCLVCNPIDQRRKLINRYRHQTDTQEFYKES